MEILSVLRDFLAISGAMPPRNIAHIGAHFGEEASVYEELGAEKVIWVEANPDMFRRLCDNISGRPESRTEHILINALIADTDGDQRELYIAGQDGEASSILHQSDKLKAKMPWVAETGQVITAPTYTIDTVVKEAGIPVGGLDTLILDTQGAELICLSGLDAYSSGIRYLLSEGTTSAYFEGGVLFENLCKELDDRGFFYAPMGVNTKAAGIHFDFMFLQNVDGGNISNGPEHDQKLRENVNDLIGRFNQMNTLENSDYEVSRSEFNQAVIELAEKWKEKLSATNAKDVLSLLLEITWQAECTNAWRELLLQSGYIKAADKAK